jgi:hypothetical protein
MADRQKNGLITSGVFNAVLAVFCGFLAETSGKKIVEAS